MDIINKLEVELANWYKTMPHLPEQGRKWLATNIWWITLVGVILMGIGILGIVTATFFAGAALSIYGGVAGVAIGGIVVIAALALVVFMAITVVLGAMAITPLKMMRHQGWALLFIIMLVHVVEQLVSFVFSLNLFGLIWGLFFTAIGGYFLFEIRDFYSKASSKSRTPTPVTTPKTENK
ncbi:MAG: hypothetical protein JWP06_692 [Candidatus Saccharibacteria bacterium]|nr:hypothetical protein [Candidatus Saccharibacteria bacterium]